MAGGALAAAGTAIALRKLRDEQIPAVAVMSSAFFVVSFIHVPIGPAGAHLVLNGLAGLSLGWAAFPAMLVALLLQAVLFAHGGVTALGVNTVVMAAPAVMCHYIFRRAVRRADQTLAFVLGALAGVLSITGGIILLATAMLASDGSFINVVRLALAGHVPIALVEACVTGSAVAFLRKVRPELLAGPNAGVELKEPVNA